MKSLHHEQHPRARTTLETTGATVHGHSFRHTQIFLYILPILGLTGNRKMNEIDVEKIQRLYRN